MPHLVNGQNKVQVKKITSYLQKLSSPALADSIQKICPLCNILEEKLTANDTIHPYSEKVWKAKKGEVVGPVSRGDETQCLILRGDTVSEWQARVREIYLGNVDSTEVKKIFESVKADIKKGRKFSKCAQELSKDGMAGNGGDLGWFGPGMMVPDFEKAVLSHKKGDLFLVHTGEFGWLIVEQSEDVRRSVLLNVTVVILKP
ncbi:MAG: peptidylprolyl isomerase [Flavobacteriales bacterium]